MTVPTVVSYTKISLPFSVTGSGGARNHPVNALTARRATVKPRRIVSSRENRLPARTRMKRMSVKQLSHMPVSDTLYQNAMPGNACTRMSSDPPVQRMRTARMWRNAERHLSFLEAKITEKSST